jgi:hypothetical protein
MVQNIDARADNRAQGVRVAFEIRDQDLHASLRIESLKPENGPGEVRRPAVREIIAVHRRYHDVRQTELLNDAADVLGLIGV